MAASSTPAPRRLDELWMRAPATKTVVAALTRDSGQVRFVGGCVRDTLLGRPVKDIDLATPDPPEKVMERLKAAGIAAVPTGIAHGTVTAIVDRRHFEITTLRHDVETDGRWARVAFTGDWTADAARRDFTINALSADPDGVVHDPFGGIDDLAAGRVRFVGDADQRLTEDVLRLLRFFRFHAYYGRGAPDPVALAACRAHAPRLKTLSGERVAGEMLRIMLAPDPAAAIGLMRESDVLAHILPEAAEVARLAALVGLPAEQEAPDALRRLGAVLRATAREAMEIAQRLRLSNAQRDRLAQLAAPPVRVSPSMSAPERRRALHRFGAERFRDLALLVWAGRAASGSLNDAESAEFAALLRAADAWVPLALPVKGQDALDLGVPPGPRVGELIAAVERWWEDGDFRADRGSCLAQLRNLIK